MDKAASLIPLTVVALGMDFLSGWPMATALLNTLSQNGF